MHESRDIADVEAQRLSLKHSGREFFVMSSVWGYTVPQRAEIIVLDYNEIVAEAIDA